MPLEIEDRINLTLVYNEIFTLTQRSNFIKRANQKPAEAMSNLVGKVAQKITKAVSKSTSEDPRK